MSEIKKICVVGLGYIGLPTAALLANRSFEVHGVDVVESVVDTINKGEIHIVEPDLAHYVKMAVNEGKLSASTKPESADVFIIAVPTPFHEGKVPNVDYIKAAARSIAPFIKKGSLVILESTSPVGATNDLADILSKEGVSIEDIFIAHCPERVLPGRIMIELTENDRIVGGINEESTKVAADFYRSFVTGEVLETDSTTAEMAKLTENSFRDVNIAFANELSMLADKFGIDIHELIRLSNHHPRVNILNPGVGVGGHCIAVDPWFIVHKAQGDAKIIEKAREVNLAKTEWVIEKIKSHVSALNKDKTKVKLALLGLSYKPDIDDLRESPALEITKKLIEDGYDTIVVEPNIHSHPNFDIKTLDYAIENADLLVVLVPHKEFGVLKGDNRLVNFAS